MPTVAKVEQGMFELQLQLINDSYDTFRKNIRYYLQEQALLGISKEEAIENLRANNNFLYKKFLGEAKLKVAEGLNQTYQINSNFFEDKKSLYTWELDPKAEHCSSCIYQSKQEPREFIDIPKPSFQPTVGDTNCRKHCKCTLTLFEG